jgi:hypothetical protein
MDGLESILPFLEHPVACIEKISGVLGAELQIDIEYRRIQNTAVYYIIILD